MSNTRAKQHQKKRKQARLKSLLDSFKIASKGERKSSKRESSQNYGPDKIVLFTALILTFFGWIMIYSGSFYVASQRDGTILHDGNAFHFFIMQGIWILLGGLLGYIFYRMPIKIINSLAIPGLGVAIALLVIVLLLPGEINGTKQWILIGPFSLQPSEIAKPVLVLYLAGLLSKTIEYKKYQDYLEKRLIPAGVIALPLMVLILVGGDLAATGVIAVITLVMMFMGDHHKYNHITLVAMVLLATLLGAVFTMSEGYRMERIENYLQILETGTTENPLSSGYQVTQILTAVGSGGLDGYGFGQSRQKYFYLQETAFTDTIFAVIAEEFGLIGSLAVVSAYFVLSTRTLKIASFADNKNQYLILVGITAWIFFQSLVHIGVNVGLIPLTGITLPLMSYGGSSFIACSVGIGIILNISKNIKLD
ncbi:MAG: FtsW/RodA/SpoVE family cell cycle protein [Candidatus Dojkabacteria bacterium]